MVLSGRVPTCDSVYSWRLYTSPAPLEDQAASSMNQRLTQSHYPEVNQSSPYASNAERLARKRQVSIFKSLV